MAWLYALYVILTISRLPADYSDLTFSFDRFLTPAVGYYGAIAYH
jgi:hypothetical protein